MFYTIDDKNSISACPPAEEAASAAATPFDSFTNEKELAELIAAWPAERLVATFNSLPGVTPVRRFKTSNAAASRIWKRVEGLGDAAQPETAPAKPQAAKRQTWPPGGPRQARQR